MSLGLLVSTPTKTACDQTGRPDPAGLDSRAHMKERDGGMEWWEQGEERGMNRNTHWVPAVHSSRCRGRGSGGGVRAVLWKGERDHVRGVEWVVWGEHMGSIHWIKLGAHKPMRWRPYVGPNKWNPRLILRCHETFSSWSIELRRSELRGAVRPTLTTAGRHTLCCLLPTVYR